MIKYIAILFTALILVQSQRPPYAGSSKPYPGVLPQYLEEQATAAAAAAPSNSTETVVNRIDTSNGTNDISLLGSTQPSTTSTIPPDIPIDALGDIDLINRIKTWPREKQPFWFINWQQIQEHRGDSNNPARPVQTQPNQRSTFAG